MVILGAGASFDSAASAWPQDNPILGVEWYRPPLAKDLFDKKGAFAQIAEKYAPILDIIDRLRHRESGTVEEKLQVYSAQADHYPERHRQLAAVRHYLRDLLMTCSTEWSKTVHKATNYKPLLDDIYQWHRTTKKEGEPVCLVTFNYDLLLDFALWDRGFKPETFDDYINYTFFRLFKLHGSADWAHVSNTPAIPHMQASDVIKLAPDLLMSNEFAIIGDNSEVSLGGKVILPAIAIPVKDKGIFECPATHVRELERLIPKITRILSIGWTAGESNFIQMLHDGLTSLKKLMVVAAEKDEARNIGAFIREQLKTPNDQADLIPSTNGFTDFINNREVQALFAE